MIKHAFRTIAAMPVLAAVVVVSLGIGIGVNTAVFSWIEALMLKPLPAVRDSAGPYIAHGSKGSLVTGGPIILKGLSGKVSHVAIQLARRKRRLIGS